jgi:signal transduction histidine kinase
MGHLELPEPGATRPSDRAAGAFQSCKHVVDILDNVLDMSKMEEGCLVLNHGPIDIHTLMSKVFSLVENIRRPGVEFFNDVPEGLCIQGDEVRLKQLVLNLVANAFKFTQAGSVRVSAVLKHADAPAGAAEGQGQGGAGAAACGGGSGEIADESGGGGRGGEARRQDLHVVVLDTGPGITPYKQSMLFQKYCTPVCLCVLARAASVVACMHSVLARGRHDVCASAHAPLSLR